MARFEDTYAEYVKYPLITKKRMFYETMGQSAGLKVIIDNGSGTQATPPEPFANATEGTAPRRPQRRPASKRRRAYEKTVRKIALFIILIAGLITLGSSMVSTYNDEYKLVLQFEAGAGSVHTPGLSFKVPFIQTTQSIPNYEMVYDPVPSEVEHQG